MIMFNVGDRVQVVKYAPGITEDEYMQIGTVTSIDEDPQYPIEVELDQYRGLDYFICFAADELQKVDK